MRAIGIAIAVGVAVGGALVSSLYWAAGRQFSAHQERVNEVNGLSTAE